MLQHTAVCLSSNAQHMLAGSGLFALLGSDFEQIFGQIVSVRVKTRSSTFGSVKA